MREGNEEMGGTGSKNQTDQESQNRREFLKRTGERALWAAPAVTAMMMASGTPAQAHGGYKDDKPDHYDKREKLKVYIWKWLKKWWH